MSVRSLVRFLLRRLLGIAVLAWAATAATFARPTMSLPACQHLLRFPNYSTGICTIVEKRLRQPSGGVVQLNRPLATITPTLDGDVLAMLAQHEVPFTAGQLHRILDRYSEEGIRKVLLRLARQGVVQSTRVGSAYTYQLNRDHLAAESIIQLAHLTQRLLEKIEKRLESWEVQAEYAAVFGSAARGTMTENSDIDIFLVRADDAPVDAWDAQVGGLASDVSRWTGNDTRPLEYTVSELLTARKDLVIRDVARDGLTVAGQRAWLTRHLRERNG